MLRDVSLQLYFQMDRMLFAFFVLGFKIEFHLMFYTDYILVGKNFVENTQKGIDFIPFVIDLRVLLNRSEEEKKVRYAHYTNTHYILYAQS